MIDAKVKAISILWYSTQPTRDLRESLLNREGKDYLDDRSPFLLERATRPLRSSMNW